MIRMLLIILTGIIVNFFWYTVYFTFLPALNVKQILALAGIVILTLNILNRRSYSVPIQIFVATFFAIAYSIVNLVAVEVNDTFDFSYANYVTTFFVWIFAGYTAVEAIRWTHGRVSISLITAYSAAVSATQCILAILFDRSEAIKSVFSLVFIAGFDYYEEIGRLYGLGAALDPAGTRFSIILVMIAFVTLIDDKVRYNTKAILWYLLGFFIISSIGNIISRTTTVGMSLAFLVWVLGTGIYRFQITGSSVSFFRVFVPVLLVGGAIMTMLYQTDPYTQEQLRYGFEGFFNWIERGEWTTGSTEVLASMWRWPTTTKGWIIGTGQYDSWVYGTDIGYCRLILYSGIIGFATFALLFAYSAYVFSIKYYRYRYMFVIFLAMSFIIWYKVSTDLFMIYALLYTFDDEGEIGYPLKKMF